MTDITSVMNNIKNLFGDDVSFRVGSESNCEVLALRNVVHSLPINSAGDVVCSEPDVLVRATARISNYLDSNGISYICKELRAASTAHSCQVIADRITVEYFDKYMVAQKVGVNKFEVSLNYTQLPGRLKISETLNWFYEHITGNVYPAVLDAFILPEVPALPIDMEKVTETVNAIIAEVTSPLSTSFLESIEPSIKEALVSKFEGTDDIDAQKAFIAAELKRILSVPAVVEYKVIAAEATLDSWSNTYPNFFVRCYARLLYFFIKLFGISKIVAYHKPWYKLFLYTKTELGNSRFLLPRITHYTAINLHGTDQTVFTSVHISMDAK